MQARAAGTQERAKPAESAAELLALLDALPANVALWDAEVRLRYANDRQRRRFGWPGRDVAGARLSDLVQPHAVELSSRYIEGALAGRPQQVERAMVDANGQRYNAHQVTHVPNVVDGDVIGYCALAVDMTSSIEGFEHARRAREDAALRAERERIAGDIGEHHVLDELTAAIGRLDAAIGRAADAVPSLSTAADAIERSIAELRATVPGSLEEPPVGAGGIVGFPAMSAPFGMDAVAPPPAGVGWPARVTGEGWSDAEVRTLVDLVPAAIAIWDRSFRNLYANRAAVGWFGHESRDDVIGRGARELLGAETYEGNYRFAAAALAGSPQQVDRTVVHPSGLRHVQAFYLPRIRGGAVDGLYTMVVDVTARVEAELELQAARAELASARERRRIADELHNMVIQRLFAASLRASLPTAVTEEHLRSVQDGIVAALDDLESALTTLHSADDTPDLLRALAHLVHDTVAPAGIATSIENVGSVEYVPPDVAAELLFVAAAALRDVVNDAAATAVVVTVAADVDEVWLRVADAGVERTGSVLVDWRVPLG